MVRDQAFHAAIAQLDALEQPLRDLHRAIGGEAELAVGFLLQGRRRERRGGPLRVPGSSRLICRRDRSGVGLGVGDASGLKVGIGTVTPPAEACAPPGGTMT